MRFRNRNIDIFYQLGGTIKQEHCNNEIPQQKLKQAVDIDA